mgnify:CR=1 FL=1
MSDPVALYDQADKLKDEGKIEESAAKLKEALTADPSYALAHSALAVVLQKLGKHEEAIDHACVIGPFRKVESHVGRIDSQRLQHA